MKMTEQRFWDSDREFVLTYSLMATVCSAICHDEISEWRQDALRYQSTTRSAVRLIMVSLEPGMRGEPARRHGRRPAGHWLHTCQRARVCFPQDGIHRDRFARLRNETLCMQAGTEGHDSELSISAGQINAMHGQPIWMISTEKDSSVNTLASSLSKNVSFYRSMDPRILYQCLWKFQIIWETAITKIKYSD